MVEVLRAGKSYGVYQALIFWSLTEHNRRILVTRKVAKTIAESCFTVILEILETLNIKHLYSINNTKMTIVCNHTNTKIFFMGMDDPDKVKSTPMDLVVCEEASDLECIVGGHDDFGELDTRLRGMCPYPMNIILMFNPVHASNWTKARFFDQVDPDAYIIETTYKDNKFLDERNKKTLEAFKTTNPYRYQVYCLGNWGTTGESYFDTNILNKRLEEMKANPPECIKGNFTYEYVNERIVDKSIKFVEDPFGVISIFEKPKENFPYVIGADTAGDSYGDFFAAVCIDNTTGHQAASLYQNTDETDFARQLYCLGRYYQNALVGIESNYSTYPIKEMQRLGYFYQFRRKREDKIFTDITDSFGFLTNKLTRPIILSNLQELVRETNAEFIKDSRIIGEMLTFIRNQKKNGRAEGDLNCHDDFVMACAITMYIREQARSRPRNPGKYKNRNQKVRTSATGY